MTERMISKRSKKQIPAALRTEWLAKMFFTSQLEIHEATGLSVPTIADALSTGRASQATIEALTKYFDTISIPDLQ